VRRLIPAWSLTGALLAGLILAVAGGITGCAKVRGTLAPNRPPETTLWVTGDVDTVGHTIRVFWNGEDPDGSVAGFEFKWIYLPGAQPPGYDPSVWTFTPRHDSLFTVYSPNGTDFPTLVVRAIDDSPDGTLEADGTDHGTPDDTPSSQHFAFSNQPPSVRLTGTPPDTTLPVAVLSWVGSDPDGIISRASYRIWLDGAEDRATIVTDTAFTLAPSAFKDLAGQIQAGVRTAYVACIDDGGP
jgi:hypothetical protein